MKKEYYKLPLDFASFFENRGRNMAKCTEIESIDQNIEMLLTTFPGEHRFDPNFGCQIWEMDFENVASLELWEERFKQYVHESITMYEPRLREVSIDIHLRDIVKEERLSYSVTVRKRADIYVAANMTSTEEPLNLIYTLYLGPLSNE